jgi:histone acetyltransferase (RNA polymerase elongator complex component)
MIVPVFLPHLGCGQRCTYCNQNLITGSAGEYGLEESIALLLAPFETPVEVALYGGNPLGLEPESLERLLGLFGPYKEKITRLRISARPGPVSRSVIGVLRDHRVRTIELGTPTFNDRILARLSRGHDSEDSYNTVRLMKEEGFETGMQVMVGLPGETHDDVRETVSAIISLAPSFIRIYPLLVIEETLLFEQFSLGSFVPDALDEAVAKASFIYASAWAHGIGTIKMGLTENAALRARIAAGPFHPAFGYLVKSEAFRRAVSNKCEELGVMGKVLVRLCPSDVPHLIGYKRSNIEKLRDKAVLITWGTDQALKAGHFAVEAGERIVEGDLADALARTPV